MLFLIGAIMMLGVGGVCWVQSDRALAIDDRTAAVGWWAMYAALGAVVLLAAH